ncbi:MAG: ATP-binding cassette domain-containing protein [Flavobacteriaceae bacterium]|jgi:cell division transport system ATP-binding protein|nr:ATP-binding cassette domain-containing protein [Flavobacteriaceae bacterium]MBT3794266.1 ATP-binding cassette domain-containing protein [Flavobacteriaceae bacterium]MBT4246709.1 ATP-binding cassette domain-containing protein [Flavobacteriaceae bacterium]MBT4415065.1 ATP-binding cassette domain-containing protein [Flavobacteriaceae bacterium]MBT5011829.1 ATP-binding cassette domain-containing protein [Flavobacteriaceae bacterium]|tara:strand:+ start:179 stop:871 length:693 start_codon:yes stop_codon:yes gene_type:complete
MSKPIVYLDKVNIKQNDKIILSNISLSINKGEFVYMIGKTGIGKSSLLRILYGDLKIGEGEANVMGINLNKIKDKKIPYLRRKLGIVFQDFKLLSDRSIEKNLIFVLKATDWRNSSEIGVRIEEVLKMVKLKDVRNKFPHELSGGEQQRVAIARALLNKPELVLADEPTGNLDPATSIEIMQLLKDIHNDGTTILIATHDYEIISKFPAKTIRIEKGRLFELSEKTNSSH